MPLPFRKAVSTLTAATALALGATLVAAPSALAVGSKACTKNIKDKTYMVNNWAGADLRTGPSNGKKYKTKKHLDVGTDVRVYCVNDKGLTWYYGKAGKTTGWVESSAFF
jgi:hypothetical protein